MKRSDLAIAGVGTGLLAIAIVGSLLFAGTSGGLGSYEVAFDARNVDVASGDATAEAPPGPAGGTTRAEIPLNVTTQNLTRLRFQAEAGWSGFQVVSASFAWQLVDPSGETYTQEDPTGYGGSAGTSTFDKSYAFGGVPEARQVEAESEAAALAQAAPASSTNGTGVWTLVVEVTTTGPSDGEFTVTADVDGTAYEAVVRPAAPDVSR